MTAPKSASGRLQDFAQLARISNLPTCLTNVLVGAALAGADVRVSVWRLAAATAAICSLYIAGMALNDVVDAEVDRTTRPGRPIPSGRVTRRAACGVAVGGLILGVALLGACGSWGLGLGGVLAATIVAYDLIHKKSPWSALLMGACRGLIYPTVAAALLDGSPLADLRTWAAAGAALSGADSTVIAAMAPGSLMPGAASFAAAWASPLALFAAALTLYITGVTVVAQAEDGDQPGAVRRGLALALPLPVLLAAALVRPQRWTWTLPAGAVLLLLGARAARQVLRQPPHMKRAVMGWLAAICVVDAFFLTLLDRPALAALAAAGYAGTVFGHRRVLGT